MRGRVVEVDTRKTTDPWWVSTRAESDQHSLERIMADARALLTTAEALDAQIEAAFIRSRDQGFDRTLQAADRRIAEICAMLRADLESVEAQVVTRLAAAP